MKTFEQFVAIIEDVAAEVKKRHPIGSRFKTRSGTSYVVCSHKGSKVVDEEGAEHHYAQIARDWARESMDESDRDFRRGEGKMLDNIKRLKKKYPVGSIIKTNRGETGKVYGHDYPLVHFTIDGSSAQSIHHTKLVEEHKQAARVRKSHNAQKKEIGKWNPKGPAKQTIAAQHVFKQGRQMLATFLNAYKTGQLSTVAGSDFPKESELAAKSTAARNALRGRQHLKEPQGSSRTSGRAAAKR